MCENILCNCKIWKQPKNPITEDKVNNGVYIKWKNEWEGSVYDEMNGSQDKKQYW